MANTMQPEYGRFVNRTGGTFARFALVAVRSFDTNSRTQTAVGAVADGSNTRADGIILRACPNNGGGYYARDVIIEGTAAVPVNTAAALAGAPVWLSGTVIGGWTFTKPGAGYDQQEIGVVLTQHATLGRIRFCLQAGGVLGLGPNAIDDDRLTSKMYHDKETPSYTWIRATGNINAGERIAVAGRVYEFQAAADGITVGADVKLDMGGAGPWAPAAAMTAATISINADVGRVVDVANLGGGGVAYLGLASRAAGATLNHAITTTSATITLRAATMDGSGAASPQMLTARAHRITAADVAALAVTLGTSEVLIGTFGSTSQPRMQNLQAFRIAGNIVDPIILAGARITFHHHNGNMWSIGYTEPVGGALLQADDVISYNLQLAG
jgi:hypothetical protein